MEIVVYACGGTGINIGSQIKDRKAVEGIAKVSTVFVDTSRSNISSDIKGDSIFLVDGLDGSGKKRDMNYNAIKDTINNLLLQHKPGDINIVIHSGGGGSGSVFSPSIVSELLSRNEKVIVLLVGSTGSLIETENTLKTLKSYESISKMREKPVVLYYDENTKEKSRGGVNGEMLSVVAMLSLLYSGDNREMDTADLGNWMNYQKVTSYSPKLVSLQISINKVHVEKGEAIISVATVTNNEKSPDVDAHLEYHTVGYIPETIKKEISTEYPVHFSIIQGAINKRVSALESKISSYKEHRSAVVEKSIISGNENSTSDGLIL